MSRAPSSIGLALRQISVFAQPVGNRDEREFDCEDEGAQCDDEGDRTSDMDFDEACGGLV